MRTVPFVASSVSVGPTAIVGLGGFFWSNAIPGKLLRIASDTERAENSARGTASLAASEETKVNGRPTCGSTGGVQNACKG